LIDQLVEKNLVKSVDDLYHITLDQLSGGQRSSELSEDV